MMTSNKKEFFTEVKDGLVRQYIIENLGDSWYVTFRYKKVDSDNWTCWPSNCYYINCKSQYKRTIVQLSDWVRTTSETV